LRRVAIHLADWQAQAVSSVNPPEHFITVLSPTDHRPSHDIEQLRRELFRRAVAELLPGADAKVVFPTAQGRQLLLADGALTSRHAILRSANPVIRVEPAIARVAAAAPIELLESNQGKRGRLILIVGSFLEEIPILGDFIDAKFVGSLQDQAVDKLMEMVQEAKARQSLPKLDEVIHRAGREIVAALAVQQSAKQVFRVVLGGAAGPVGWVALGVRVVHTIVKRFWKTRN
jgi:hypothetical protein